MVNYPLILRFDSDGNPDGLEQKKDLVLDSATIAGSQFGEVGDVVPTFVPPKMTTAQRNAISSPATGSVVYNTTTNLLNHYNGTAWLVVGAGAVGVSQTITINDGDGFTTHALVFTNGILTGYS